MTEHDALVFAIECIEAEMRHLLSWGSRSPKNIRKSAFARTSYWELNDARRTLRRMLREEGRS